MSRHPSNQIWMRSGRPNDLWTPLWRSMRLLSQMHANPVSYCVSLPKLRNPAVLNPARIPLVLCALLPSPEPQLIPRTADTLAVPPLPLQYPYTTTPTVPLHNNTNRTLTQHNLDQHPYTTQHPNVWQCNFFLKWLAKFNLHINFDDPKACITFHCINHKLPKLKSWNKTKMNNRRNK